VEDSIQPANVLNDTVFVFSRMEHASVDELLLPCDTLLTVDAFKKLLKRVCLLFLFSISDDFNDAGIFLRDLDNAWLGVKEFDAKDLITLLFSIALKDFDLDLLFDLTVVELKNTFFVFKIASWNCRVV